MKIEAVIVCVNYADFLCWTLPTNKQVFDNMVVVTTLEDKATQKLCEHWHIRCVRTNVCYDDGKPGSGQFNKAKMINEGLKVLNQDGWIVHMDADIWLPPKFRFILERMSDSFQEDSIYSMDRMNCNSLTKWLDFLTKPDIMNENEIFVHCRPFDLATRLAKKDGWVPLGYFQMWHNSMNYQYPVEHSTAGRTDLMFSEKFPREKRVFMPELYCVHLDSTPTGEKMGANWYGRTTPRFGCEIFDRKLPWWKRIF